VVAVGCTRLPGAAVAESGRPAAVVAVSRPHGQEGARRICCEAAGGRLQARARARQTCCLSSSGPSAGRRMRVGAEAAARWWGARSPEAPRAPLAVGEQRRPRSLEAPKGHLAVEQRLGPRGLEGLEVPLSLQQPGAPLSLEQQPGHLHRSPPPRPRICMSPSWTTWAVAPRAAWLQATPPSPSWATWAVAPRAAWLQAPPACGCCPG